MQSQLRGCEEPFARVVVPAGTADRGRETRRRTQGRDRHRRPTEKEMRTVNKVLLAGRLTRDPEMRSLASGKSVTNFNIATNEFAGGKEKAEYHTVVTWDKLAEVCGQYLGKGLVSIQARPSDRHGPPRPRTAATCEGNSACRSGAWWPTSCTNRDTTR